MYGKKRREVHIYYHGVAEQRGKAQALVILFVLLLILGICGAVTHTGSSDVSTTTDTSAPTFDVGQAEQQQAVSDANDVLSTALSNLKDDSSTLFSDTDFKDVRQSYANDWFQMQQDYQQEQTDAEGRCSNVNTVRGDDNTVTGDLNTIRGDDNTFRATQMPVTKDLFTVKQDIQTVQSDWQQLKHAVAANTTGTPAPSFSSNGVNTAIQAANNQVTSSQTALKKAQAQATNYDNRAVQLKLDADSLVANLQC